MPNLAKRHAIFIRDGPLLKETRIASLRQDIPHYQWVEEAMREKLERAKGQDAEVPAR
jgi:hypothetical protein